jgi:hypothetical protein
MRKLIIKIGRKTQVRMAGSNCSSGSDIFLWKKQEFFLLTCKKTVCWYTE